METLALQERFEIEVLDILNSKKLLAGLLFGGGTMLRLCHGLNRYSVDLDFYFLKKKGTKKFHREMINCLSSYYKITDAAVKYFTLLYEFKSSGYPRRLKIEIRRQPKPFRYEETIAFSPNSSKQVLVKSLTLEQMMTNKIEAFLDRGQIRDCFDMEFLVKKGVVIKVSSEVKNKIIQKIEGLKPKDFRAALGPILTPKDRAYYIENGFKILLSKLG